MKRACVLGLFAMVLFTGCASNNAGKIEGTAWKSLAISGSLLEDGEVLPAGAVQLQFTKGGTLYLRGPQGQYQGKYALGGGNWVTFHFDRELDGRRDHRQRIMIEGNRLTMIDSDGMSITFQEN